MEFQTPQKSCFYLAQTVSVSDASIKPRTIVFTTVALIAFASGSVLCRTALGQVSVASGLGYIIWHAALQHLNAKHGALVQLAVPVLAATGGVVFLAEAAGLRLVFASRLILGGIRFPIASPWDHRYACSNRRT